jgi:hypothetical protein
MAVTTWSISQNGRTEPFELQVSRGQITGHRGITVFGYNPDIDTAEETVWPFGGIITHPSTAVKMSVSSSSSTDNPLSTGAWTITLEGLDANYNEIGEVVTLNGQTPVLTQVSYLRINRAFVSSAGTGNSAVGDIYMGAGTVTGGIPATVYQIIKFDYNSTTTGHYTVPAGYTAYMDAGSVNVGQVAGSNPVTCRLVLSMANNIRLTSAIVSLNNGTAIYEFIYPLAIPEKTDIEATGIGSAANNFVTSYFNILLIKNDGAL